MFIRGADDNRKKVQKKYCLSNKWLYIYNMLHTNTHKMMSNFNTQTTENQKVSKYSDALLTLVNAAELKGFDFKIEEYERKVIFRFRLDREKNSMIWFHYVGYGTTDMVKRMYFYFRYNGCNGAKIQTYNQHKKSQNHLGLI